MIAARWRQRPENGLFVGDEPGLSNIMCHQTQNNPHPKPDLTLLSPMSPPERKHPSALFLVCQGPELSVTQLSLFSLKPSLWPPGSKPGLAWVGVKPTLQQAGGSREAKGYYRHRTQPPCVRTFCPTRSQVGLSLCSGHLVLSLCHSKLGFRELLDISL